MAVAAELWEAGIPTEILMKATPKVVPQLKYADNHLIPFAVFVSKQSQEKGEVIFFFYFIFFFFSFD